MNGFLIPNFRWKAHFTKSPFHEYTNLLAKAIVYALKRFEALIDKRYKYFGFFIYKLFCRCFAPWFLGHQKRSWV